MNHHYVGGYYGAASEEEMKRELVQRERVLGSLIPLFAVVLFFLCFFVL